MGGSLTNFILARNFQSRSKSRFVFDLWALWGTHRAQNSPSLPQNSVRLSVFSSPNSILSKQYSARFPKNVRKQPKISCFASLVGGSHCRCDRSGHLQNGKPARRKNPGKMGKKMENGPRLKMAKKWLPKWKNGPQNGIWAIFFILAAIFWPFWAWGYFPFSLPFSRDFCVGQVFHSVNGHSDRKTIGYF